MNAMTKHTTLVFLMMLALLPELRADELPFTPFLGDYVGEVAFEMDGVELKRNLNVGIKPKGKGFSVSWTTTTFKPSGKVTQKAYSVDFSSQ